ncbi:S41 family peptidase [Litoribacter populi]|uniref:S41 family peptidase n=1 Tax=Litoribacter populi TaxID=2598460 RepID=UPI00163D99AF|nr:S41 family peptidase [Litoribacter populi]
MKYYHPSIARGEYNWDFELFKILPQILDMEDSLIRDEIIYNWIIGLGKFQQGRRKNVKASKIKISPDLDWIHDLKFSNKLTALLLGVKDAERPEEHHYVALRTGVGNPEFENEEAYASMVFPDAGFRLLALYRYWNIIQYYFPYRNLIGEDWKYTLEEFIPRVVQAKNETEYTLTMLELIGRVNDTHAQISGKTPVVRKFLGQRIAAVDLTFIEDNAVVTGYHDDNLGEQTGLIIGDVILTVNGEQVEDIIKRKLKYYPGSNHSAKFRDMTLGLLRTNELSLDIEFIRDGIKKAIVLNTYPIPEIKLNNKFEAKGESFQLIDNEIAYINHGVLKKEHLPLVFKQMAKTRGLIIDLRNYPTDFPLYGLCDYLLPKSADFAKISIGSIDQPGLFTYAVRLNVGRQNPNYYKGKVVIILNEITQSSSEFQAMAYRLHPNATVIGSTTAGADGNVSTFSLPGGISTTMSGVGVYYPDGRETQRVGIVPDIEIKPTIQGIKDGRDELLEKAVEIIYNQ